MKIQLFDIISVAAVISYFVPLILVLIRKLGRDAFFMLFAAYWTVGGLINLMDIIPGITKQTSNMIGLIYNILDIPIILGILWYTTTSQLVKKFIVPAIAVIGLSELISLAVQGMNYDSLKYPLGAGIALVLVVVGIEIVRYMNKIAHTTRENAKMFIYAAVFFEYATFIVIYIFDYYITSSNSQDSYIIYYLSTLVAILIASCGYLLSKNYEKRTLPV